MPDQNGIKLDIITPEDIQSMLLGAGKKQTSDPFTEAILGRTADPEEARAAIAAAKKQEQDARIEKALKDVVDTALEKQKGSPTVDVVDTPQDFAKAESEWYKVLQQREDSLREQAEREGKVFVPVLRNEYDIRRAMDAENKKIMNEAIQAFQEAEESSSPKEEDLASEVDDLVEKPIPAKKITKVRAAKKVEGTAPDATSSTSILGRLKNEVDKISEKIPGGKTTTGAILTLAAVGAAAAAAWAASKKMGKKRKSKKEGKNTEKKEASYNVESLIDKARRIGFGAGIGYVESLPADVKQALRDSIAAEADAFQKAASVYETYYDRTRGNIKTASAGLIHRACVQGAIAGAFAALMK